MQSVLVGILGYGHLGQFLVDKILSSENFDLAFVWNRSLSTLEGKVAEELILKDIEKFADRHADIIIEVAHPSISERYGEEFLKHADYMIGSPTALADRELEVKLRRAAINHGLYVPSGAFWGGEDIKKMTDIGSLKGLKVTMKKHPSSFKLHGSLKEENDKVTNHAVTLYDGPVRELCPLAPNNVNTMAAAAICAHNLGFDKVQGCLVSDPKLTNFHIVEVEVTGPRNAETGDTFTVHTVRSNPAQIGAITGSATYNSFYNSLIAAAHSKGPGVHIC